MTNQCKTKLGTPCHNKSFLFHIANEDGTYKGNVAMCNAHFKKSMHKQYFQEKDKQGGKMDKFKLREALTQHTFVNAIITKNGFVDISITKCSCGHECYRSEQTDHLMQVIGKVK